MIFITTIPLTLNILSVSLHCPAIWISLQALKSRRVARSQRQAALQIIQATPQSVSVRSVPANQGAKSKEFAEELKRIRDHQKSVQNHHISQVHPVKNYLPQQQKWGAAPVYPLRLHENNQACAAPVYPLRLHENNQGCVPPVYPLRFPENNQRPQQCFNKPNGSCGPGYASLTPVHRGHNYQPLWPPSKHQLTSSSEFKPQEAPQTCFNNHHGYSQQLSARNPFAYGTHTGYGNYQEQWPIGASWQQPPPEPAVQRQPTP